MKLASIALPLSALLFCGVAAAQDDETAKQPAPQGGVVNRIAATVNGRPITACEVRMRLAPYFRELTMLYPQQGPRFNSELVKAKKEVMKDLIERELVLSEFETKGYIMKDDIIEEEINRRILVGFNGDRDAFLDSLRKSGMSLGEYRESVRKEVTVQSMRSTKYERGIPPTPDEIQREYDTTKSDYRDISQDSVEYDKIFIPMVDQEKPEQTPEERYNFACALRQQLDAGSVNFDDAAREHSRDAHAADGGRWPAIKRCDLAVDFANVVFSVQPGQVFGPIADNYGFTIVRVRDKHLAPAPPLSNPEVKERVDDAVRRKQSEKRYREWVERLRGKAVIRTFI
ncbi:MAG: SurA N-terminal domain-containing protein [Akkermansia sp.]|nr:SurA N-terminal domain-containing protein [Akkermansia sp.]